MRLKSIALLASAALAAAAMLVGPSVNADDAARPRQPAKPNVLLIVMDDMRSDDLDWMRTVQRRIAARGTSYENFYAPTSLCCPSRASMLRGQYPHNTGVLTNAQPDGGWQGFQPSESTTLATVLDPTYRTGHVGKYLNGYRGRTQTYVPPGWDDWKTAVRTYHYLKVVTNNNGVVQRNHGVNSPTLFGAQAARFLKRSRRSADPFFLTLSFVTPHNGKPRGDGDSGITSPFVPGPDRGTYRGPRPAANPAYNEADISDKTGPVADLEPLTQQQKFKQVIRNAQRRESLASADRAVRRVLDTLRDTRQDADTYVIFLSDNGYLLGEHRLPGKKGLPYEPASRLPLLISGPGVPSGNTWTSATGMHDIAPTILDMTGTPSSFPMDGQSVLASAGRPDGNPDRAVLLEQADLPIDAENDGAIRYAPPRAVEDVTWKYRGIVSDGWKLISWDKRESYELYDLESDPYELTNVYGQSGSADVQLALQDRLDRLWLCRADACAG
ncbi:MAG: sulfatase [Nocardioidaceae bacterium]|nr:sulfatase [Nocardioidaceae bacterium]